MPWQISTTATWHPAGPGRFELRDGAGVVRGTCHRSGATLRRAHAHIDGHDLDLALRGVLRATLAADGPAQAAPTRLVVDVFRWRGSATLADGTVLPVSATRAGYVVIGGSDAPVLTAHGEGRRVHLAVVTTLVATDPGLLALVLWLRLHQRQTNTG